ncbi:hypothetical protein M436DRAFT_71728 [Aureobasidium namibiae CBS 147.97]|uniref:Uncharacterized protein n=1 Tax=Aureobasidium namibiae CBS 147.97 TaxID=1043004 RepID=A0A074XI84_9PEZI
MPRVSKTKAPVVATPRRATRSTVRAGSASLEEPIEVPAPRRRGSRSKTPESKIPSFEKLQPEQHLPALAEEEVEQSPRILLPQPIDVAPIVDASPYVTPQHYHIAATRNLLYTPPAAAQSPRSSPAVAQSIYNSPAGAQSIHNSPTVSQLIQQSPISSKSLHNSSATTQSVRSSATVSRSVQQSPTVTKTVQQTIEIYSDGEDEAQDEYQLPYDNDVAEDDQEDEEAVQEAAASQLAQETAEAGLSHSHPTSPVLFKSPTTVSSIAGHSSLKRRRSARSDGFPRTPKLPKIRGVPAFDSPLSDITGNSINWREYFNSSVFKSSSPAPQLTTPLAVELMGRAMNNEEIIPELTDRQSTAVLLNMRKEIMRLRKIEEQFLASKQPQSAAKPPQSPAVQEQSSPEIPRTISRLGDLRYQRTIATPARKRLLAQREAEKAEKAAAAAAAAAEAERISEEEEQNDQTPSRSGPSSTSRSSLSLGNSRRKASQHSTPEAQTPQPSSQNSAPPETPAASPAWGLTSLFGSVKNIFTHRPNFSPIKQIQEQPQEQNEQQPMPQSQQPAQQHKFNPSPLKNTRSLLSSSQQSPTPKPRAPAPPATPAPIIEEVEDDGLYGQTRRKERRRGYLPDSQRRKRDTPAAKPKEPNADFRASQLALGAQRTAEREQAQEKADRLERERLAIVEELKLRDSAYNVGDKRKMQVNVDDLAVIPRKAAGASSGTYGLMDDFFQYDDDSDIVEMDEDEVQLLPVSEHPTKRIRLDDNVFQPKTPTPALQPITTSPVKQAAAPQHQQPTSSAASALNYSELTQQAIERQRQKLNLHNPKQPSRLRNVERLSTGSTVGASSPQQPITAPLQNTQEVAASVQETQELARVAELPQAPAPRVINWPELGPPMMSPESFARAEKIYTPELRALDHEFYMKGFENAMNKSIEAENKALANKIASQREFS